MIQLAEHFRSDSRSRHSEWLRQQRWFIKARQDKVRREENADKHMEGVADAASLIVVATEAELQRFEKKLDVYDEATVIALMENQRALDLTQARLDLMLDQAHVIEDGRRVFKSQTGLFVIDEFGNEISPDELDADLIGDDKPTAEQYLEGLHQKESLLQDRQKILEFQEKADDAREKIQDGDLSKSELDELDAELADALPVSVRNHVPGFDTAENAPNAKGEFQASSHGQSQPVQSHAVKPTPGMEPS